MALTLTTCPTCKRTLPDGAEECAACTAPPPPSALRRPAALRPPIAGKAGRAAKKKTEEPVDSGPNLTTLLGREIPLAFVLLLGAGLGLLAVQHAGDRQGYDPRPPAAEPVFSAGGVAAITPAYSAALVKRLRSANWAERDRARNELARRNLAVPFQREQDSLLDRRGDTAGIADWTVELAGGRLTATYEVWLGGALLPSDPNAPPPLGRLIVLGDALSGGIERTFELRVGANQLAPTEIVTDLPAGRYTVELVLEGFAPRGRSGALRSRLELRG